jgi:hypothetical protein
VSATSGGGSTAAGRAHASGGTGVCSGGVHMHAAMVPCVMCCSLACMLRANTARLTPPPPTHTHTPASPHAQTHTHTLCHTHPCNSREREYDRERPGGSGREARASDRSNGAAAPPQHHDRQQQQQRHDHAAYPAPPVEEGEAAEQAAAAAAGAAANGRAAAANGKPKAEVRASGRRRAAVALQGDAHHALELHTLARRVRRGPGAHGPALVLTPCLLRHACHTLSLCSRCPWRSCCGRRRSSRSWRARCVGVCVWGKGGGVDARSSSSGVPRQQLVSCCSWQRQTGGTEWVVRT